MSKPILGILILAAVVGSFVPAPVSASVPNWQKGSNMISWAPNDLAEPWFAQSLRNLRGTHADSVAFVLPYYQSTFQSSDVQAGPATPSTEALITAINTAHSLGFKVTLKPHLQVLESLNGWRAYINPTDRSAWFTAYGAMLTSLGKIAEEEGVEQIVIGTELINMTDDSVHAMNTPGWKKMIADLRAVYSGKLTYSANWGESGWNSEKDHLKFWEDLDYIGLSAYYYLAADSTSYTPADLLKKWAFWNDTHIKPLAEKYGKPVIFTEVGYRSRTGTLQRPPRWEPGGTFNEKEQADAYEALFSYWNDQPFMQGVFLWDWENHQNGGGPGNTNFTPQNKLAQQVMTKWFGAGVPSGEILAFKASSTPVALTLMQTSTLNASVFNMGTGSEPRGME
jgi:hypothetical protein